MVTETLKSDSTQLKSYPKILPLVGKNADYVLGNKIEITEKVDGSMFAFGKDPEGILFFRSKGQQIDPAYPQDMFRAAVEHILSVRDRIPADTAFYGETLQKPRHNTLTYGRVPRGHIALFGMFDWARTRGVPHNELSVWAFELGCDVVPLIYEGILDNLAGVVDLLDRESFLGGAKIEGVVLKDYDRPMEFAGMVYPLTVLKFVSEQFKEKHQTNPDWTKPSDSLEKVFFQYKAGNEARWRKAIQHRKEAGAFIGEPKDIGPLMKDIWEDLVTEEADNLKEELFRVFKKRLAYAGQAGFPEWFKTVYLLEDTCEKWPLISLPESLPPSLSLEQLYPATGSEPLTSSTKSCTLALPTESISLMELKN